MTRHPGKLSAATCFLIAATVFAATGCSLFDDGSQTSEKEAFRELLQQQRRMWKEEGYENYRYRYQIAHVGEAFKAISVTVEGGEIARATVNDTLVQNEEDAQTVEGLFDEVRTAVERDTRQFSVRFNEERGYLRFLSANYKDGGGIQIDVSGESLEKIENGEEMTEGGATP